jgi:hypothetical protein
MKGEPGQKAIADFIGDIACTEDAATALEPGAEEVFARGPTEKEDMVVGSGHVVCHRPFDA